MTDLRFERTEYMIQTAFLDLLKTNSFNEISIAQLAKKSMIDRTTFYAHYQNLSELAIELIARNLAPFKVAFATSAKKQKWNQNFDSYTFFTSELIHYLINHREDLLEIRSLPLGTNSFDLQLRKLCTTTYAKFTHLSTNDFTVFLLVNLAMSNLDFVLEHQRIPSKTELQQGLKKMEELIY